jgi:mono/diheme cytochrome c family protein
MTKRQKSGGVVWLGAVALGLVLVGCGSNTVEGSAVTGVALSEGPVTGTVQLSDSSEEPKQRTVSTRPDGTFSVDVAGLTPPYMLRVAFDEATATKRLYAVTEGNENLDVNSITDVAFSVASGERDEDAVFLQSGREEKRAVLIRARTLLVALQEVLAPLFERYGITDPAIDKAAVRALLEDVSVVRDDGVVTVRNKATGGVIYSGPLDDLASGAFYPENMPAGPGTTPPPATCTYTYGAWGTCQADGTQTRAVLSSSPSGCTGTPVLTQSCTAPPPVLDGAALYTQYCSGCHGTSKLGSSASSIQAAIDANRGGMGSTALRALTAAQIQAIASAGAPPPAACTYTYGTWGTCSAAGTQTRAVLSSTPSGCTGTPVLTQSCTPPPAACTYTYGTWGTCSAAGTQTRAVLSSTPSGCTGTPVLTQSCTPPPAACTYTYSAWGTCSTAGRQTRTVLSSSPSGCSGTPVLSQACTYTAPIDGAALYTQYCSGCHGNSKKGSSASSIQAAIDANRGGMGSTALRALTPAQIQAISTAP